MPRKRNAENRGLPLRWTHTHGAYYYQVPVGLEHLWDGKKKFRLGGTLPEAYKTWADRLQPTEGVRVRTVSDLLDRYALEVVPTKRPTTRTHNLICIPRLRAVFGALDISAVKPRHVYRYVDLRSAKKKDEETGRVTGGRTIALREIEVLSHAYTKAVEWGYLDRHPFKDEVRLAGTPPRSRYVEDWEIIEALSLDSRRKKGSVRAIQAYMRIKLMTGMSRGDLLRLKPAEHFKDDGIHIQRHKTSETTGKRTIYEWTPDLRAAVKEAIEARPALSHHLFCNRRGEGYFDEESGEAHGWDSMWQRFMERVLAETEVKERFTEHDMRAKCASDAASLEHARALLSHVDSRTTNAIYRRKPETVKPLDGVG